MPEAALSATDVHRDLNRVISWFISIRWVAVGCVILAIVLGHVAFHYHLPFTALYLTAGGLLLANLTFHAVFRSLGAGRGLLHAQIAADYLFLLLLVYFAGALENPFASFFVFHVMLTGFLFPPRIVSRYVVGVLMAIVAVVACEYAGVIPHFSLGADMPTYRSLILPRAVGLCTTIAITGYLISSIKHRIEEKGRRVEIELDRYRQLDRAKSNFILQVTHELRGPVAAVSGFHEMVLRGITGDIGEKTRSVLERADRRTENLLTIIDEMIDFAYMKSDDETRYRLSAIEVGPILEEIVRIHQPHAQRKTIQIRPRVEDGLFCAANRDLLTIILGNLVNNAIKYSPAGRDITVAASTDGDRVHLSVSDTGYGIDPDEIEKIFEEFYRTRAAREIERDGTGLGLPIVKRAVEALGGSITVYSEIGVGTVFDVYVPTTLKNGGNREQDSDHR